MEGRAVMIWSVVFGRKKVGWVSVLQGMEWLDAYVPAAKAGAAMAAGARPATTAGKSSFMVVAALRPTAATAGCANLAAGMKAVALCGEENGGVGGWVGWKDALINLKRKGPCWSWMMRYCLRALLLHPQTHT